MPGGEKEILLESNNEASIPLEGRHYTVDQAGEELRVSCRLLGGVSGRGLEVEGKGRRKEVLVKLQPSILALPPPMLES